MTANKEGTEHPLQNKSPKRERVSLLKSSGSLCTAIILSVLLGGCGGITQGKGAADAGVVAFHQQLNAQNYGAIVAAADPGLFQSTSKTDTKALLEAVHRKLGNTTASQNAGWNVRTFNMVTTVVLTQNTKFEKGGGTETFVFRMRGKQACLLSYNINSRELILK